MNGYSRCGNTFEQGSDCYHYKIPEQGNGTDDHLLPLGDWFITKTDDFDNDIILKTCSKVVIGL